MWSLSERISSTHYFDLLWNLKNTLCRAYLLQRVDPEVFTVISLGSKTNARMLILSAFDASIFSVIIDESSIGVLPLLCYSLFFKWQSALSSSAMHSRAEQQNKAKFRSFTMKTPVPPDTRTGLLTITSQRKVMHPISYPTPKLENVVSEMMKKAPKALNISVRRINSYLEETAFFFVQIGIA